MCLLRSARSFGSNSENGALYSVSILLCEHAAASAASTALCRSASLTLIIGLLNKYESEHEGCNDIAQLDPRQAQENLDRQLVCGVFVVMFGANVLPNLEPYQDRLNRLDP